VGGVRESVVDGQTGFVVPPRDPAALADRLGELLADAALRRRLGSAGRDRYEAEFTFDAMLGKTVKVWESVLARP
jgi:D-inositol-3-phosphate glycosyltransferase